MTKKIKALIPGKLRKALRLLLHKGDNYRCPFCNYSSKDLSITGKDIQVIKEKQIVGAGRRPGGCFKCGSTDRERLMYVYLQKKLKLFDNGKDKKVLHIAPEKNLSKKLLDYGLDEYVCGDLFTEGYTYPSHVRNMNVLNIPFQEGYFDIVICNHVLEHIPKDHDAMKELYRVLKKGGKAILQVPISKIMVKTFEDFSITTPEEREKVFGQFDHLRIYGQDYTDRLGSVGFNVERLNISKEFAGFGLNPDEDLFIARKG